jgi:hypothetical protein
MKRLSLLFSIIFGKFNKARAPSLKETVMAVLEEAAYRSRKPVALLLGGIVCILIFCGGFFMSLIDLTGQFDRDGSVQFTANLASGLILVAIASSIFYWIFASAWPGAQGKRTHEKEAPPPQLTGSSLEQALSLLVMDYIKEREYKREHRVPIDPLHEARKKEPPPVYNN